jgi:tetratricopeptide (TPR) repeat protein
MSLPWRLSATLLGTVALVSVVHTQAAIAALNEQQINDIARQVTVKIDGQAPGSGVIIARQGQTYYVLTAAHVVATPDEYDVITPDGQKHTIDYKLLKKLPEVDLAVVMFTSPKNYQVVEIGDSSQLREGVPAYIAGFPHSKTDAAQSSYRFSAGELDAVATRPLAMGYALAYRNDTFTGMSGGAILNQQGQLIGIHGSSKTSFAEEQGIDAETGIKVGLNLGIPINTFLRLAAQISSLPKFPAARPLVAPTQLTASDFFVRATEQRIARNVSAALADYDQVIRLNPKYATAYVLRGNVKADLGNLKGAIADYEQAIRLNPRYADAFNNRGVMRRRLGDLKGAIGDYGEVIRLVPTYASAYNNRGAARSELGDDQGAISDYSEAIRLNPAYALAYRNRGDARRRLQDFKGAITDYEQAIRINPKYADAFNNRGVAYMGTKDYQRSLSDFDEAIRLNPKLAGAFSNKGLLHAKLQDFKGAIANYDQALKLDASLEEAYLNRGSARMELYDFQGAIADFSRLIDRNPKSSEGYTARGAARFNSGDFRGAVTDFDIAIRLNPKDSVAVESRARALARLGNQPSPATPPAPQLNAEGYLNQGGALLNADNFNGAIASFDQAIRLNPNYGSAYYYRGLAKYLLKNFKDAIVDFDQAIRLEPNNYAGYRGRGLARARLQDFQGALVDYNQAIRIDPNQTSSFLGRSMVRDALGDRPGAIADLQKTAELFRAQGHNQEYERTMNMLRQLQESNNRQK